jgi:drug/metabolite transporter (DMT)-like permease
MQTIAVLSMLFTVAVTLTVGVRLLLVARRTRGLPEVLFGFTFLSTALGQAFGQIGLRLLWSTPGPLATTLNALTFAFVTLGTAALGLVVWRVFRPGKGWGAALCAAVCGLTLLAYAVRLWDGDFAIASGQTRGYLLHVAARGILLAWTATEAIHYWSLLRKRLALGLADPMATNQILLWGISGIFAFGGTSMVGYALFVLHQHPLELFGITAVLMATVVGSSVSMWCAFFPPGWMRRRVERGAVVA